MTAAYLAVLLALSARAETLAKELGSPSFHEREAAQAQLLALGGPALPAVSKASASPDPEVARRARSLVKDIGFRLDCRRLLAGTTVRLDFANAPLSDVLTSLSKQTGYALGVANLVADTTTTVTIRTGDVPFWKAVEEVGKAAGLTVAGLGTDAAGARFYVPEVAAAPKTPGEKVAAWQAEVEGLVRFGAALDAQARGHLEAYRNDLRHIADAIERPMARADGKMDLGVADRMVKQAQNIHTAARNLFSAAGVRIPVGPNGRYPVVLTPVTGPTGTASAGIWVETSSTAPAVSQLVKSYSAQRVVPTGPAGPTVHLRVVPEPKIDWVRTTGIRVEHAVDEQGRAVAANLTTPPRALPNSEDMVLLAGGRVFRQAYADGTFVQANPYYASVLVKSDLPYPNTLREFRGAVLGVVRAANREVVSQALKVDTVPGGRSAAAAVADQRDMLNRFIREPVPQSGTPTLAAIVRPLGDNYVLGVTLSYSGGQYSTPLRDAMTSSNRIAVQQVMIAQGGGVVIDSGSRLRGVKSDSMYGLRVTDAAGKPFQLTGSDDLTAISPDGTGTIKIHFSLMTAKTEGTTGPPARIAWHASRLAAVEVPFDLANVPVVK